MSSGIQATAKERIVKNSIPEPNTGCWLWTACTDKGGYGKITVGRKYLGTRKVDKAHAVSYREFIGPTKGLCVLHRCDTPSCVNPAHLWLGTNLDNMRDAKAKGRKYVKRENGC